MSRIQVGIDVLERGRADRVVGNERSHRWLFTAEELRAAGRLGHERALEWLVGRFCAKEAVAKVLGQVTGWPQIELLGPGVPRVALTRGAARRAQEIGLTDLTVSLSHQPTMVVAVAVGLLDGAEPVRPGVTASPIRWP